MPSFLVVNGLGRIRLAFPCWPIHAPHMEDRRSEIVNTDTEAGRQRAMDAYKEYNRGIGENYKQNLKMLDNQLLVLSSGALGLSLTFVTDLVDLQEAMLLPLLISSWVLLGTGILVNLFGLRYTTSIKTIRDTLDAGKQTAGLGKYSEKGPDPKAGKVRSDTKNERIDLYNKWSFWLFVFGLIAMVTFISVNILWDRYG